MISRALLISLLAGSVGGLLASYKGRSPVLWFFLCFFMPLLVILPLLLPAVPQPGSLRRCSKCGTVTGASSASCPGCGTPFPIEMVECPSCGKYVRKEERCPECNSKLKR